MPATKSVQAGSFTVTDTTTTKTVTITSVDASNSVLMMTQRNSDTAGRLSRYLYAGSITDATTLTFARDNSSFFSGSIVVDWTVVEFEAGALQSLQTGSHDCTAGPSDIALGTAVDATKAVPLAFWTTNDNSVTPQSSAAITVVQTTNPGDTLRFDFNTAPVTGRYNVRWQLVEFKSADVSMQSGTISGDQSVDSGSATISSVDLSKTLLSHGGTATATNISGRDINQLWLSSATQVNTQKGANGSGAAWAVVYYVIEFEDGTAIESGTTVLPGAATVPSSQPSFTALDVSRSAVWSSVSTQNFRGPDTSDPANTNMWHTIALNSPAADGVTITRVGTSSDINLTWQVVQWVSSSGSSGITGALSATLDDATLSAAALLALAGTLAATLESATLSSAAKLALAGALAATLADATLSADATLVNPGIHGELAATLADATLSAAGSLSIAGSLSATLADARLSARGGNPNTVATTTDTLLRHRRRRWR